MAEQSKLNQAAAQYARMQDPDWRLGKKKDLEDFSKGAQKPGDLDLMGTAANAGKKLKNAWKALTE